MISCPHYSARSDALADGGACSSAEARAKYKHGGKPSDGTCLACSIRPQEIVTVTVPAKKIAKITTEEITRRIEANHPFCEACPHFNDDASSERVRCDASPKACKCISLVYGNCPEMKFTNGD